jgi:ABC-type uncharacterized transport system substrate-binding protein
VRLSLAERRRPLPVQQATKVELFINLKTAKALGLDVSQSQASDYPCEL